MELIRPTAEYKESFIEAVKELELEGRRDGFNIRGFNENFEDFLDRNIDEEKGINLPADYVPHSVFWLVDGGVFIGSADVRHTLTEKLLAIGGHIGYSIRPTERGRGYGTKILELSLFEAKKLGIEKVLITCDDDNTASARVIEKNGGVLENKVEHEGKLRRRYWIENK